MLGIANVVDTHSLTAPRRPCIAHQQQQLLKLECGRGRRVCELTHCVSRFTCRNNDETIAAIRALYSEDYALLSSDAAKITAPPEPSTTPAPPAPRDAPQTFCVEMTTTKGSLLLEAQKIWAPLGVQVSQTLSHTKSFSSSLSNR